MIAYLPLLFAVIGALVYALASSGKVAELGRIAFFAGFLVTMWTLAGHTVRLMP